MDSPIALLLHVTCFVASGEVEADAFFFFVAFEMELAAGVLLLDCCVSVLSIDFRFRLLRVTATADDLSSLVEVEVVESESDSSAGFSVGLACERGAFCGEGVLGLDFGLGLGLALGVALDLDFVLGARIRGSAERGLVKSS